MEIWKRGNEAWPDGVVLFIERIPFSHEEAQSFKEIAVAGHLEVWLRRKNRCEDSDGSSSDDDENCQCHYKVMRDLVLPCGNHFV